MEQEEHKEPDENPEYIDLMGVQVRIRPGPIAYTRRLGIQGPRSDEIELGKPYLQIWYGFPELDLERIDQNGEYHVAYQQVGERDVGTLGKYLLAESEDWGLPRVILLTAELMQGGPHLVGCKNDKDLGVIVEMMMPDVGSEELRRLNTRLGVHYTGNEIRWRNNDE